jgi:uncharacterized cupredoxin-like copper-binding protein
MTTKRRMVMALAFAGLMGLVGCGDDDDDDTASGDSASEEEATGEGDLATYCEKSAEIEILLSGEPEVDFETATEEEITQAMKDFAAQGVPVAEEIQASVPEENRENVDVLVASLTEVAETGDPAAFETPETEAASTADHAYGLESCGWQVVNASASEYAFDGIPGELEAGTTSFELSNEGTELHELLLLRKKDDTTESFDELLELPEDEAQAKVDFVGAAFATPGEEGAYAIAELEAGDYMAICFIPVGTVDEETEVDGPPHFTQGMKTEFTVS